MLLAKLKVLQQARLRAEAEALAAAAEVDIVLPQSISRALVKQGSNTKLREHYQAEACSAVNQLKRGGDSGSDGDGYQEVDSSGDGAVPELLTDFDAENEWCENVISGSDDNGNATWDNNVKNSMAAVTAAVLAAESKRREYSRFCTPESKRMRPAVSDLQSPWDSIEGGNYREDPNETYGSANGSATKSKKPRQKRGTATDPQSMAARARREKIAAKVRRLQSLVPGTEKLDTASMLEQAIVYVRELQSIVDQQQQSKPATQEGSEKSS